MKKFPLLLLIFIFSTVTEAQTTPKTVRAGTFIPTNADGTPLQSAQPQPRAALSKPAASSTAAPEAAPKKKRWRLTYFGEYLGPRFNNFDLQRTQGPGTHTPAQYTSISHAVKIGYEIIDDVILGNQIRAAQPFNPARNFELRNWRGYISWAHMIDTNDVDMKSQVDVELPTSPQAKAGGMLVAFNIRNYWTLKTSLRNWSFSFMTLLRPTFYNVANADNGDFEVGIYPFIQYDLAADWALIFEASFDAAHTYANAYFDLAEGDPDNFNLGLQYSFNAHVQVNPAVRFFPSNMQNPVLYLGVSAAL